ncbi:MAG: hypothetical protein WKF71_15170 [Pyrinomonadaceae bacterium]
MTESRDRKQLLKITATVTESNCATYRPTMRAEDLTDWLFTYQAADGFAHAFDQWKQNGKTHWLVAALVHAQKDAPQAARLIDEADKIANNSVAYPTARYHQIRLLIETENRTEAKQKLDAILAKDFNGLTCLRAK